MQIQNPGSKVEIYLVGEQALLVVEHVHVAPGQHRVLLPILVPPDNQLKKLAHTKNSNRETNLRIAGYRERGTRMQ